MIVIKNSNSSNDSNNDKKSNLKVESKNYLKNVICKKSDNSNTHSSRWSHVGYFN